MNLPNKLTLIRVALVPVFMFFYLANFVSYGKMIALAVFIIAALTDFADGKIARSRNLVTDFGKLFDPIADKLLVLGGLILICADQTIPVIMSAVVLVAIIGRDFIVTGLRSIAASKGKVVAADKVGKYKAFVIDIGILMLIVVAFNNQYNLFNEQFAYIYWIVSMCVLALGALLSVISCINYLVKNREVFKDC